MAARGRRGEAAAKGGRGLINPEELAKHYTRFRVTERILLTGHSHQAWPDVAFEAQQQAWLDAAEYVDDVWEKAFEKANEVRRGFARLLDDTPERIALAQNTHELVVRFLSALRLGNAFLRFPQESDLRPVVTGWFSEFADLSRAPAGGRVAYGPGPARFAGATYDFTSHYRAAAVFKFFEDQKLTPPKLRELNQHQMEILSGGSRNDGIGGFLAIPAARAAKIQKALRKKDIWTDSRGEILRLGPAPYVTDAQISEAADTVAATIHERRSP